MRGSTRFDSLLLLLPGLHQAGLSCFAFPCRRSPCRKSLQRACSSSHAVSCNTGLSKDSGLGGGGSGVARSVVNSVASAVAVATARGWCGHKTVVAMRRASERALCASSRLLSCTPQAARLRYPTTSSVAVASDCGWSASGSFALARSETIAVWVVSNALLYCRRSKEDTAKHSWVAESNGIVSPSSRSARARANSPMAACGMLRRRNKAARALRTRPRSPSRTLCGRPPPRALVQESARRRMLWASCNRPRYIASMPRDNATKTKASTAPTKSGTVSRSQCTSCKSSPSLPASTLTAALSFPSRTSTAAGGLRIVAAVSARAKRDPSRSTR
mmetsp:Transcript_65/g.192  ORF Transcript_65/g.192 Transcript_65/m.192 type:complete len:332 (-) Transcript_65:1846-2841(-)